MTDYWVYADTTAIAYAERKDFEVAIEYETRAIDLLTRDLKFWRDKENVKQADISASNLEPYTEQLELRINQLSSRLKLFREQQPFRHDGIPQY